MIFRLSASALILACLALTAGCGDGATDECSGTHGACGADLRVAVSSSSSSTIDGSGACSCSYGLGCMILAAGTCEISVVTSRGTTGSAEERRKQVVAGGR